MKKYIFGPVATISFDSRDVLEIALDFKRKDVILDIKTKIGTHSFYLGNLNIKSLNHFYEILYSIENFIFIFDEVNSLFLDLKSDVLTCHFYDKLDECRKFAFHSRLKIYGG